MTAHQLRFKADWYNKKIKQNRIIQNHLIKIIEKNKNSYFPWNIIDLHCLSYEDLLEIAIATVNKKITITLGTGADFDNGADAKFSIVRKHSGAQEQYSALVPGCEHKEHILCCVYESIQNKFYYFSFPSMWKEHSIPFHKKTGEPNLRNYMWLYEKKTFRDMALSI